MSDILSAISPPASECKAASVIDSPTNSGVGAGDSGNGSKKVQQENWQKQTVQIAFNVWPDAPGGFTDNEMKYLICEDASCPNADDSAL